MSLKRFDLTQYTNNYERDQYDLSSKLEFFFLVNGDPIVLVQLVRQTIVQSFTHRVVSMDTPPSTDRTSTIYRGGTARMYTSPFSRARLLLSVF